VYSWDEDENPAAAPGGGFTPPWSGTTAEPAPILNRTPVATGEFDISQLPVVSTAPGVANGWMLFVWPPSNGASGGTEWLDLPGDIFQTWMGTKLVGFGQFSGAKTSTVMGHFGCDAEVLPDLGWGPEPPYSP
jgi:hypothetical protein